MVEIVKMNNSKDDADDDHGEGNVYIHVITLQLWR